VLFLLAGLVVVAAGTFATLRLSSDGREAAPVGAEMPAGATTTVASAPTSVPTTSARTPDAPVTTSAVPTGGAAAGAKTVPVALTYVDWDPTGGQVEASGFVPEVVELGGSCTLSLAKGDLHVETTRTAEPDATTTNCGLLTIAGDKVPAGTWTAALSYRSTKSQGTSAPMSVTVPAR
jgi:hypothetical protein